MNAVKNAAAIAAASILALSSPAIAQSTRSADALPTAAAVDTARATAPVESANEVGGHSFILILFALIGAIGLLVAASGGGGNDSPG